ncbi:MAG: adenine deaminase [Bacteroidota bacterium]
MKIQGQFVDLHQRQIRPAEIHIIDGKIKQINALREAPPQYILPGFVDAHIHIESSMLVPAQFAKIAVRHGTVATVSDPHEIANVLGEAGVDFMLENARQVPLNFFFGAPSCVPATNFESAGATIDAAGIERLLQKEEILYLAEMMNFPGVLHQDQEVMAKIAIAKQLGKPIDGHAPGLRGEAAKQYAAAGISTDHECVSYEEAKEKISYGMKILIREGSAAKNFAALIPLLAEHPKSIMFCSDDKHPDDLLLGHINQLVARGLREGYNLFDLLRAASVHPVEHYSLPVGLLREGDPADFIITDELTDFRVRQTYLKGECVYDEGRVLFESGFAERLNQFNISPIKPEALSVPAKSENIHLIEAIDGELITRKKVVPANIQDRIAVSDPSRDILKMVVVNRYQEAPFAKAFVQNFGLQNGAIASSVGHDSHNIIAVGVTDQEIAQAVNLLIAEQGGIAVVGPDKQEILPLPIAGIMSDQDGESVGGAYASLDQMAKQSGSTLRAPFMTLSFMALLVIPAIKLSDKGLFDGESFSFLPLFAD